MLTLVSVSRCNRDSWRTAAELPLSSTRCYFSDLSSSVKLSPLTYIGANRSLLPAFVRVGVCQRAKKKAKNKTRGTEKTGTVFLPTPVPQGKDAFSAAPTFEEFLKFKQAERGETELKFP